MNSNEQCLFLLNTMQRSLAHSIRTPLSVVLNELRFLQNEYGGEGLALSIKRCNEIVQILSGSTVPSVAGEVLIPVHEFLGLFKVSGNIKEQGFIRGDMQALKRAQEVLVKVFDGLNVSGCAVLSEYSLEEGENTGKLAASVIDEVNYNMNELTTYSRSKRLK